MIDLHSHILFGIDDGAASIEESLDMAKMASDDGVTVMACTPHNLPGVYEPSPALVMERVAQLNARLAQEGVDLMVVSGCEAHVRPDMVARLDDGALLPVQGGRHVLCEAPWLTLPPHLDRLFIGLVAAGYSPILAHVERYRWIEHGLDWVRRMRAAGVLMQVTGGSILGDGGVHAQRWARRLLGEDLVDLVASDAHNTTTRPPGLQRAYDAVRSEFGAAAARHIFLTTPADILRGPQPAQDHSMRKAS